MTHVVLINSDRIAALEQLLNRPGIVLSAITKAKYAHLYTECAAVRTVPDVADVTRVLEAAVSLTRSCGPLDAVVAPLERGVISAGFVRSTLNVPGMPLDVSLGFVNKLVMKSRLRAAGLPVAPFHPISSVSAAGDTELRWPIVIKPAVGAGSQNVRRIVDRAELLAFAKSAAGQIMDSLACPLIAESEITMNAELHCDGSVSGGRTVGISTSRYLRPMLAGFGGFNGSVTLHRDADREVHADLVDLHSTVVAVLGMRDGVTHMEAYVTDAGLVIGEVTCRPGGGGVTTAASVATGRDLWADFIDTALGVPLAGSPSVEAGLHGWYGLPARNGRVVALTDPRDLAAIPGVRAVEMNYRVGDLIDEKLTSVFNAGIAHIQGRTATDIAATVSAIEDCYRIAVE
ncbi:MAG: hypothetical protein ACQSGP_00205 [Frankia sp.]